MVLLFIPHGLHLTPSPFANISANKLFTIINYMYDGLPCAILLAGVKSVQPINPCNP
jgi:hypothetical protein